VLFSYRDSEVGKEKQANKFLQARPNEGGGVLGWWVVCGGGGGGGVLGVGRAGGRGAGGGGLCIWGVVGAARSPPPDWGGSPEILVAKISCYGGTRGGISHS